MAIANQTEIESTTDDVGLACQCCGDELVQTSTGTGKAGALHAHVWCPNCSAGGCLSTNMPGRRPVLERGRALRGE